MALQTHWTFPVARRLCKDHDVRNLGLYYPRYMPSYLSLKHDLKQQSCYVATALQRLKHTTHNRSKYFKVYIYTIVYISRPTQIEYLIALTYQRICITDQMRNITEVQVMAVGLRLGKYYVGPVGAVGRCSRRRVVDAVGSRN